MPGHVWQACATLSRSVNCSFGLGLTTSIGQSHISTRLVTHVRWRQSKLDCIITCGTMCAH